MKYLQKICILLLTCSLWSCGDDNEAIFEIQHLTGSWELIKHEGFSYFNGETITFEKILDITKPNKDSKKIVITSEANKYNVFSYKFNKTWILDSFDSFTLDGNIIKASEHLEWNNTVIAKLNVAELIIETRLSGTTSDNKSYNCYYKETYHRKK